MRCSLLSYSVGALVAFGILGIDSARAALIGVSPPAIAVAAGGTATIDVPVSDLGGAQLGAFDVTLSYDPSLLTPTGAVFGPSLGDPSLLEALTSFTPLFPFPGSVEITETSLLSAADLAALQPAAGFSLASISFDVTTTGVASFQITNALLADASGRQIAVPEPGAALLLGSGLLWVAMSRRKPALARR